MADQEQINTRLQNIRSVEPILGAMRTISLGSWQAALGRQQRIRGYSEALISLLPAVLPHLARKRRRRRHSAPGPAPVAMLVIGSERGLCGAFSSSLAHEVEKQLLIYKADGLEIELHALGKRADRALKRRGLAVTWTRSLPTTAVPDRELAAELVDMWVTRYQSFELDAVDIMYNAFRNSTLYEPVLFRLFPPDLSTIAQGTMSMSWPPPYIDTDPVSLYTRIIQLWMKTEMYRILLASAAAEHSARYQLMEGAVQNSKRLIDELTLALQSMRQQAITAEMQELAAGAGLTST